MESQFDILFTTETGYHNLNQRIAKTRAKQNSLLLVLQHPEQLLRNDDSELVVRQQERKSDVSFGPSTQLGLQARNTFLALTDTASELGISFYAYVRNRVSETNQSLPMLFWWGNALVNSNSVSRAAGRFYY